MIKVSESLEKVGYAIRELVGIAKELEKKGRNILYLNIGDPLKYDFKLPMHIIEAYYKASKEGKNYYSDSQGVYEFREALSRYILRRDKIFIPPEDIIVTNGVAEAINFVIRAFVEPGDEILIPSPSYPSYLNSPYMYHGIAVEYKCIEEEGWRPDIDDLRKKISERTRFIVIINPNNPTGALYDGKYLKEIVDVAAEYNLPIVSDEIYDQIILDGSYEPISKYVKDTMLIGLNGFSKAYLMTGWRLGYIYIYDPSNDYKESIKDVILRQARLRLCVNTPVQYAGIAALEGPQDHIRDMIDKIRRRRYIFMKSLKNLDGVYVSEPKAAFYIFPRIDEKIFGDDKEFVKNLLFEEGVLVVQGSGFGMYGRGHFRSVLLAPEELIEEAVYRIESYIRKRNK